MASKTHCEVVMVRTLTVLLLLFILFLISPTVPRGRQAIEETVPNHSKPLITLRNHGFEGTVTNVTERSITVAGSGICHPTVVEHTFPVSDALASGGYDPSSSAVRYYLRDVHVGDK